MGGFLGLVVSAVIASAAWLYQKAWERREQRFDQYKEMVDLLPAFTVDRLDPDKVDAALAVQRRVWLVAPDDVIRAINDFIRSVETGEPDALKDRALAEIVLTMRRDTSFRSAILPRFFRSKLSASEVGLKSARRPAARN